MKQTESRFSSLLTVKSIVTLLLTIVFCVLAVCGRVDSQEFLTVFSVVIAFYFGTQSQKRSDSDRGQSGT